MKKKLLYPLASVLTLLFAGYASAGIVSIDFSSGSNIDAVTGLNSGGLDNLASNTLLNGDPGLSLIRSFTDATSGATFDVQIDLTGNHNDAAPGVIQGIRVGGSGAVNFGNNNQRLLTFDIASITQTGGPLAVATFNGISAFDISGANANSNGNVGFTLGAQVFGSNNNGAGSGAEDVPLTTTDAAGVTSDIVGLQSLATPRSIDATTALVERDAGSFGLQEVVLDFDVVVATIPEPSSLSLMGIVGLALLGRRRR